jgi:hypothetical protein
MIPRILNLISAFNSRHGILWSRGIATRVSDLLQF